MSSSAPTPAATDNVSCRACLVKNQEFPCQITRDEGKFFSNLFCLGCQHPLGSHVSYLIGSSRLPHSDEVVESLKLLVLEETIMNLKREIQENTKGTMDLKREVQRLAPPPNINLSSSELGHQLLASCPGKFEFSSLPADALPRDSRPIVDSALYTQILGVYNPTGTSSSQLPPEKLLVAAFTPTLAELVTEADRESDLVLVNSEDIRWIPSTHGTIAHRDKPDLFVIPRVALQSRDPPSLRSPPTHSAAKIRSLKPEAYLFGEGIIPLRDSVRCLIEAKKAISLHAAVGEIFPKLQNLFFSTSVLEYRCILFDQEKLYFLVFNATGLCTSYHLMWTAPHTRAFFLDFLSPQKAPRPIWLQSLIESCQHFHVTPINFLGSGATGKVFKVESTQRRGEFWALKVAEKPLHTDPLRIEAGIMKRIRSSRSGFPDFIQELVSFLAPGCEAPLVQGTSASPVAGSILLGPVGDSIAPEERSFKLFLELFSSLFLLHRYSIRHGDPRIPNVIRVRGRSLSAAETTAAFNESPESRLVWIDLREIESDFSEHGGFAFDLGIFFRSFFNHSHESAYEELEKEYTMLLSKAKRGSTELQSGKSSAPPAVPAEFQDFVLKVWNSLNGTTR